MQTIEKYDIKIGVAKRAMNISGTIDINNNNNSSSKL